MIWLFFTLVYCSALAIVNYIDEYLTTHNSFSKEENIHVRIGGLVIMSTVLSFVGAITMYVFLADVQAPTTAIALGLLSAVPLTLMYLAYFYILNTFPVHQVLPLFQLSTIWLILFDLIMGASFGAASIVGIFLLVFGAYLLDAGSLRLSVPTKLLWFMIPATSLWAAMLYITRIASLEVSANIISFYQLIGVGFLGLLLFASVAAYRRGFFNRFQNQRNVFVGLSLANEGFNQIGNVFAVLAVAVAPLAAYVTAASGMQSVVLLLLLSLFPITDRVRITTVQIFAICLIALGVAVIEIWR